MPLILPERSRAMARWGVNAEQVAALRMLLAPTGWLDRAAEFARVPRGPARAPGGWTR